MVTVLNTSTLAEVFHGFPHLDFNFQNTTTVFSPTNIAYQQALMFNGIYLFFMTTCLFLIFGFYFLVASCYFYCNCNTQILKPRPSKSKCLRILIGIFAVLSCAALGLSFYGNNKAKDGIEVATEAMQSIYNQFDLYKFKNNDVIQESIRNAKQQVIELQQKVTFNHSQELGSIEKHLLAASFDLKLSGNLLEVAGVDLQTYAEECTKYDDLRWWIFTTFLCFHLLLVLVILYATYTNRKCALIGLTVMAVFSLFLNMSIISISSPLSIGAADICLQPKQAYLQYVQDNASAQALIEYYMDCSVADNELFKDFNKTSDELSEAYMLVQAFQLLPIVRDLPEVKLLLKFTREAIGELNHLIDIVHCKTIHDDYQNLLQAVCNTTIEGFGLMILSCLIIVVFLIAIMLCITPLWKATAPLKPILKKYGVHIITESYQGPPGYGVAGSESFHGSSSFDASYKSIDDPEDFEHLPLINKRNQPHSYRAVHGSTEFLSVEEERRDKTAL
ncbi:protein tweety homolog 3-like [Clytia hemisphaerica]|uniref:Protein tweety homolog n=1 Tax=Clytia hemisphaerica TaxID=252671 RepID=A0A7M5XAJ0_9CNID